MVTRLGSLITFDKFVPPTREEETEQRENDRLAREYELRRNREKRAERIKGFRCTDAMREALLACTYTETEAVKRAHEWWANRERPWLVLSGRTGCGKSMAAASIPADHAHAKFIRADELVRLFSSMFGEQYEQQQTVRDAYLLVIDDLGCELDHARMLPALLDLLDARQSARKHPTIVTTNLTPATFRERYANDRLSSRMAELVRWEGLTGEDLRRCKP